MNISKMVTILLLGILMMGCRQTGTAKPHGQQSSRQDKKEEPCRECITLEINADTISMAGLEGREFVLTMTNRYADYKIEGCFNKIYLYRKERGEWKIVCGDNWVILDCYKGYTMKPGEVKQEIFTFDWYLSSGLLKPGLYKLKTKQIVEIFPPTAEGNTRCAEAEDLFIITR